MNRPEFEKIRPTVVSGARGVVLEIGAGAGNNFRYYEDVERIYALEPSPELIAIAREQTHDLPVEFLMAGAESIPLSDASVDTVVSTWTLCSVENPAKVLQEIKRVLRPGGRFLFVDHRASSSLFIRAIQKVLTPITKHFTGNCHMDRDIARLVREAGFKVDIIFHPNEDFKPLVFNYQGIGTSR